MENQKKAKDELNGIKYPRKEGMYSSTTYSFIALPTTLVTVSFCRP